MEILKFRLAAFSCFLYLHLMSNKKKMELESLDWNQLIAWNWRLSHEIVAIIFMKKGYFLVGNKKSRFDFADELKVGYVRYKHLTQITIKVQLFWRWSYEM